MKLIANIATQPKRVGSLAQVIHCIKDQFDLINVYLNEFDKVPGCLLNNKKIHSIIGANIADNGKFYFIQNTNIGDAYFTIDDDIFYSKEYSRMTHANLQIHKNKIVTYHGRVLSGVDKSYYKGHKESYSFASGFFENKKIDVAGTGCSAFIVNDDGFGVDLYKSKHKKMSDLIFSLEASLHKKEIICCPHEYGFMKAIKNTDGICEEFINKETPIQNSIANQIYFLNYGND